MMICTRCVLPETFPGIRFGPDGVCQFCRQEESSGMESVAEVRRRYEEKFALLRERLKGKGSYDALMAYSGGKDSSYTLALLRERWGMSVLALTFDHGYLSPAAISNIRRVTAALGVDHIYFTPSAPTVDDAFRRSVTDNPYPVKALERASSICQTCMNLAKSVLLRTAIEMGIPFIVYGWSPGQAPIASSVMRLNEPMIRQSQNLMEEAFGKILGTALHPYLLQERHYRLLESAKAQFGEVVPYHVHPLAFLEYSEETVTEGIRRLGWIPPGDTDANSSNCLLNSFANRVHVERYGFHPYAFEIAGLVRLGCMTREEGLTKLNEAGDPALIETIRRKLKISSDPN